MSDENVLGYLSNISHNLRITKVVATRSVKTKSGDFFAGISSAYESRQDDVGGHGADMDLTLSASEIASAGMPMLDAKVAHIMVCVEASIAAWRAAYIDGAVSENELNARIKHIKQRGSSQISGLLKNVKALNPPASTEVAQDKREAEV